MMRTEAWRSLDCVARCCYLEIKRRYAGPGSNNGRIPMSLPELVKELHVGKSTAHRALRGLEERGFIVRTKNGSFDQKTGEGRACEWRLTEHMCDVTGELPTKEFARWRAPKKLNAVPP